MSEFLFGDLQLPWWGVGLIVVALCLTVAEWVWAMRGGGDE